MLEKQPYVLAMYDFSAKQEYIYKTNAIKEIVGASSLIKDAFRDFLTMMQTELHYAIDFLIDEKNPEKTLASFDIGAFKNECAEVYEGGGNLFLIFRDKGTCVHANKHFSKMILKNTYGLNLVCALTDVTGNFREDQMRLYEVSRRIKNTWPMIHPVNVLPYTLIDRTTSLPIAVRSTDLRELNTGGEPESYSWESCLKRLKYNAMVKDDASPYALVERDLDNLITDKYEESLLAVIYIDGNAMGDKVKNLFSNDPDTSYNHCIAALRQFSAEIDDAFIRKPIEAIKDEVAAIREKLDQQNTAELQDASGTAPGNGKKEFLWYRRVIGGGDEITIICNARYAFRLVSTYFQSVISNPSAQKHRLSSCAGIAVFHSHDPFSTIYEIAEQCCESAKKRNRDKQNQNFYLDFHFCHSGVVNDLDYIRKTQEGDFTNRPHCYHNPEPIDGIPDTSDPEHSIQRLKDVAELFHSADDEKARGDIKAISDSIFSGDSYFKMELARLRAKYHESPQRCLLDEAYKKEMFDATVVHDLLWFKPEQKENGVQEVTETRGGAGDAGH